MLHRFSGGLTSVERFSGLKSIISGPAGGVVGMALTSWDEQDGRPCIGLDMGGTSTDVSRFAGRYEQVFETTLAGVTIQSPQLDVNTVASGGSSRLFFRNGLFTVGPESASAHPGPTCYRKGGPLTITDANLVTGHLALEMFPKIFGPDENQGLDEETTRKEFDKLTKEINEQTGKNMSPDEVAQGFIRIANETYVHAPLHIANRSNEPSGLSGRFTRLTDSFPSYFFPACADLSVPLPKPEATRLPSISFLALAEPVASTLARSHVR